MLTPISSTETTRGFVIDSPEPGSAGLDYADAPAPAARHTRQNHSGAVDASAHREGMHLQAPSQEYQPSVGKGKSDDMMRPGESTGKPSIQSLID